MQLDLLIWETASPRTHKLEIVNESLVVRVLTRLIFKEIEWDFR